MGRIIVISDTHWSQPEYYAPGLGAVCEGADLIIHSGDAVDGFVLEWLEQQAPVRAVVGNCDRRSVRERWPREQQFDFEGFNIGVLHGHQVNLREPSEIVAHFIPGVQLIIHGHTHLAANYEWRGVRIFNPGSLSEPRGERGPTYGLITIRDGLLEASHHDF
jgi:putative phosphoesterase